MATWYARPSAAHGGTNAGTSYANAWQGWASIGWASIAAGDTLYLCGAFSSAVTLTVGAHNGSAGSRVVIRGDYAGDAGSISFTVGGTYVVPRSHTEINSLTLAGVSRVFLAATSLANHVINGCALNGGTNPIFMFTGSNGLNYSDIAFTNNTFVGGGCAATPGSAAAIDWFVAAAAAVSTVSRLTITGNAFTNVNPLGDGRGVIGLRTESDTGETSIVTDLIVRDNTFTNCRGYAVAAEDGHSFGAASPQYGLWKGCIVERNTITDQTVDATLALGGGFSLFGFSLSATAGFGQNKIVDNVVARAEGAAGGINVAYSTFFISQNNISDLTTQTIDACGILIDDGNVGCLVTRNTISRCYGKTGINNSGAGLMILNADSTAVHGNTFNGVRCGLYLGSIGAGKTAAISGNTFANCTEYGIYVGSTVDRTGVVTRNNAFTYAGTGTGYSVYVNGAAWSAQDYDSFDGFLTISNHTLGANCVSADPLLSDSLRPLSASPLLGAGTHLGYGYKYRDADGKQRPNPPAIGAYDAATLRRVLTSDPATW